MNFKGCTVSHDSYIYPILLILTNWSSDELHRTPGEDYCPPPNSAPLPEAISYLERSNKPGKSWDDAAFALSMCMIPHHRHPLSGFGGCIPEECVSQALPGGPVTICLDQQK